MSDVKTWQKELERLSRELEVFATDRAKNEASCADLEKTLMGVSPGDEAALEKLMARQSVLKAKDDLLRRRIDLTKEAIEKAKKTLEVAEAQARAERAAGLRAELRKAEAATKEAVIAAERTISERLEKVHALARELHELEREAPFAPWAAVPLRNPLPTAALVLQQEEFRESVVRAA